MKKVVILLMTIGLISGLFAGCSKDSNKNLLQKIKDKGELVIATSPDYPPFEYLSVKDGKEEVKGFEIEIAKKLADKLGVKLVIKQMEFDGIIAAVKSGQVDLGVSGFTPNAKRKKVVDFSTEVYTGKQTFIVSSDDVGKYKSGNDLKGKNIGAQLGSIQDEIAKRVGAKNVTELKTIDAVMLEVANKNLDAAIVSDLAAKQYSKNIKGIAQTGIYLEGQEEGAAFVIPKGEKSLLKETNSLIKKLKDDNQLDKMFDDALGGVDK